LYKARASSAASGSDQARKNAAWISGEAWPGSHWKLSQASTVLDNASTGGRLVAPPISQTSSAKTNGSR